MYRYFVQAQLDHFTGSLYGYEFIIREYDAGNWVAPLDYSKIIVGIQAILLKLTAQKLALKVNFVSFNLSPEQILNPAMATTLFNLQPELLPVKFVVELDTTTLTDDVDMAQLTAQLKTYTEHGIELSLDGVSLNQTNIANVATLLPLAQEVKFHMADFRDLQTDPELETRFQAWQTEVQDYNLRYVATGVQTAEDEALLDDHEIALRQGDYYGKPHEIQ
ncbi:EAL domain-containing protein [Secundilactobacillus muriivasis]